MLSLKSLILLLTLFLSVNSFAPPTTTAFRRFSSSCHHQAPRLKLVVDNNEISTIQILMSDTGGGHRASANALRDALDILHPGKIQCDIVDVFTEYGPVWPYNDYPKLYKIMAEYSFLWDWFYRFGETSFGLALNEFLMETICFSAFEKCLDRPSGGTSHRADMVVSVHPLCQDLPLKILSSLDSNGSSRKPEARTTPFVTVVTDLGGAHPTWFNPNVDKCFVPSDALYNLAKDRNLQPSQIVQCGLPIRKGFWSTSNTRKKTKEVLRAELKIDTDLPTVLLVGGGDGMGGIVDIAKSLGERLGSDSSTPTYQMIVVCGNNKKAKESLSNFEFGSGVKTYVQGFVNNMDEWMQASDALVTKAGPGTIAEASICGLPCMLFSYLPGQEEGNVPFVQDAGFGTFSDDPNVIAETVRGWLASPDLMEQLQSAAFQAARPSATLDIAKDLAEMLFQAKQRNQSSSSSSEVLVRVSGRLS